MCLDDFDVTWTLTGLLCLKRRRSAQHPGLSTSQTPPAPAALHPSGTLLPLWEVCGPLPMSSCMLSFQHSTQVGLHPVSTAYMPLLPDMDRPPDPHVCPPSSLPKDVPRVAMPSSKDSAASPPWAVRGQLSPQTHTHRVFA